MSIYAEARGARRVLTNYGTSEEPCYVELTVSAAIDRCDDYRSCNALAWVCLTPDQAREMARMLTERASQAESLPVEEKDFRKKTEEGEAP